MMVIEDRSGNLPIEGVAVLSSWNEYCDELYNYQLT